LIAYIFPGNPLEKDTQMKPYRGNDLMSFGGDIAKESPEGVPLVAGRENGVH
jgi:hypothetical protein